MVDRLKKTLLIIDDDPLFCDSVKDYFKDFLDVVVAHTGEEGIKTCSQHKVDVVLLDQKLPDVEGYTLCESILRYNEQTKIIFITAYPSFDGALKAIRSGAYDYLSKPFELEELKLTIDNALRTLVLERVAQVEDYRSSKESEEAVLIGGEKLSEVRNLIGVAAQTDAPVLITGETGTGKNIVAKAIHYSSKRKGAFISINCSTLPESLIEAELFGYEKGAFTGAMTSRKGIFEMAEGGTLFLDEIGEMPMHLQTRLLSVLEDGKIKRLGSETIRPVSVRIIAATNTNIEESLGRHFRPDLYYRLSVIRIHLPPLRERKEDIPELCKYLLTRIAGTEVPLEKEEIRRLMEYDWPGNVRELKNILERAYLIQRGRPLRPSELIGTKVARDPLPPIGSDEEIITLEEMEKNHIRNTLKNLSGNLTRTAEALGISLSTLKRKLKEYNLK
ncbi:MAG: sigma-54-dependent transcriptional regulator [Thermodesulfovibrionales bacterium]